MNLQENIRRIRFILENDNKFTDRVIDFLNSRGLKLTINFFGYTKKVSDIIKSNLNREIIIDFINDVIDLDGGLSVFDLDEDPIFYGKSKIEYKEIYYFGRDTVSVKVWDMDFNDLGDLRLSYEALSDTILLEILEYLLEYYLKNVD